MGNPNHHLSNWVLRVTLALIFAKSCRLPGGIRVFCRTLIQAVVQYCRFSATPPWGKKMSQLLFWSPKAESERERVLRDIIKQTFLTKGGPFSETYLSNKMCVSILYCLLSSLSPLGAFDPKNRGKYFDIFSGYISKKSFLFWTCSGKVLRKK